MDPLTNIAALVARLIERSRDGRDAPDLRQIQEDAQRVTAELAAKQQERHRIMAENLELKARIEVLTQQIALLKAGGHEIQPPKDVHITHLGAVFVRKASGRILDTPYCRDCRAPLRAVTKDLPYTCSKCQSFALFRPSEIHDVLLTLSRQ